MIASFQGGQYLVGVAGGAASLISNQDERERLVRKVELGGDRWKDAWALENVKVCYGNNKAAFRKQWDKELHWTPTWKCPSNLFFWLDTPLLLDPKDISGKKKLVAMFGAFQPISRVVASRILNSIGEKDRDGVLGNLKARCAGIGLDILTDIEQVKHDDTLDSTSREALVHARLGQGKFREKLLELWSGSCAVSGCAIPELLRASHIKPWRDSTNRQRIDSDNGLLLEANLDALFDSGLIAFEDSGNMLVSGRVSTDEQKRLGIPRKLRKFPNKQQCRYLAWHRENRFQSI